MLGYHPCQATYSFVPLMKVITHRKFGRFIFNKNIRFIYQEYVVFIFIVIFIYTIAIIFLHVYSLAQV